MQPPLAAGSVSYRSYPPGGLAPTACLDEMRAQAALAVECGFDGVMTSEHHGGFPGYLPNPLQLAGFLLDAMPTGWAAPCPLLLPVRPPALVVERRPRCRGGRVPGVGAEAVRNQIESIGAETLPAFRV